MSKKQEFLKDFEEQMRQGISTLQGEGGGLTVQEQSGIKDLLLAAASMGFNAGYSHAGAFTSKRLAVLIGEFQTQVEKWNGE